MSAGSIIPSPNPNPYLGKPSESFYTHFVTGIRRIAHISKKEIPPQPFEKWWHNAGQQVFEENKEWKTLAPVKTPASVASLPPRPNPNSTFRFSGNVYKQLKRGVSSGWRSITQLRENNIRPTIGLDKFAVRIFKGSRPLQILDEWKYLFGWQIADVRPQLGNAVAPKSGLATSPFLWRLNGCPGTVNLSIFGSNFLDYKLVSHGEDRPLVLTRSGRSIAEGNVVELASGRHAKITVRAGADGNILKVAPDLVPVDRLNAALEAKQPTSQRLPVRTGPMDYATRLTGSIFAYGNLLHSFRTWNNAKTSDEIYSAKNQLEISGAFAAPFLVNDGISAVKFLSKSSSIVRLEPILTTGANYWASALAVGMVTAQIGIAIHAAGQKNGRAIGWDKRAARATGEAAGYGAAALLGSVVRGPLGAVLGFGTFAYFGQVGADLAEYAYDKSPALFAANKSQSFHLPNSQFNGARRTQALSKLS
jgi:hypothetical protein